MLPQHTTLPIAKRLLGRVVRETLVHEDSVLRAHQKTPLQLTAYGTMVRTRRLAAALHSLAGRWSYESRLLFRSIVELYFNYSWIKLRPHSRATRYIRFDVVEHLRIAESLPGELRSPQFQSALGRMRKRRTATRHLFRVEDNKGRRRWARDWSGMSFEARVRQVQSAHRKPNQQIDNFTYGIYRWLSSTAHGGSNSLREVLEPTKHGIRPKVQPEPTPSELLMASAILLLGVLNHCADDLHFSAGDKNGLSQLMGRARRLAGIDPA